MLRFITNCLTWLQLSIEVVFNSSILYSVFGVIPKWSS